MAKDGVLVQDMPQTEEPEGLVTERIKLPEKLSYALGDVASNVVWAGVGSFITFYYTNAVGIAAATAGTIFLVSRLLDGVSDVIMGAIVDRTKSKYGKARPWLLWMAVPFFIATVLLFAVPGGFSPTAKVVYAFITYNLMSTVVYTAVNLPYGVMTSLETDNPRDRVSLNIFRMTGAMGMMLIVNNLVMPLVQMFGGGGPNASSNPRGWTITFTILGFTAMVLFFLCFKGTRERVLPLEKKPAPLKKAIPALLHNRYWFIMLLVSTLGQLSSGLMGGNIYFAKYWLGNETLVGLLMMAALLPAFLLMPFMNKAIAKFGKRNCVAAGNLIAILGSLIIMTNPSNFVVVIAGSLVKGVSMAPLMASSFAMLADVIDYGEWRFRLRTDGLVYSAASFGAKVGAGLGAAMLGWILAFGGFDAALVQQGPAALSAIRFVFVFMPMIISACSFICLQFYNLDKLLPQIRTELKQRKLDAGMGEVK